MSRVETMNQLTKVLLYAFVYGLLTRPLNPIALVIALYTTIAASLVLNITKIKYSLSSRFDIAVGACMIGLIIGLLNSYVSGVNTSHMLRYSGGLLFLPAYFILRSANKKLLKSIVIAILRIQFYVSIIALVTLFLRISQFHHISLFVENTFLGGSQRSGLGDLRLIILSTYSCLLPCSFLLIFKARDYIKVLPERISLLFTVEKLKVLGFILFLTGVILLFSKTSVFYMVTLIIIWMVAMLSNKLRFTVKHSNIILLLGLTIIGIGAYSFLTKTIDPERLANLYDPIGSTLNNTGYAKQIKYLLTDIPIFGSGPGSSVPIEIMGGADAPYGVELSYLNFYRQYGLVTVFFLPIIIITVNSFLRLADEKSNSALSIYAAFNTYLFFAFGNPVLFHPQLNLISFILLAYCEQTRHQSQFRINNEKNS